MSTSRPANPYLSTSFQKAYHGFRRALPMAPTAAFLMGAAGFSPDLTRFDEPSRTKRLEAARVLGVRLLVLPTSFMTCPGPIHRNERGEVVLRLRGENRGDRCVRSLGVDQMTGCSARFAAGTEPAFTGTESLVSSCGWRTRMYFVRALDAYLVPATKPIKGPKVCAAGAPRK